MLLQPSHQIFVNNCVTKQPDLPGFLFYMNFHWVKTMSWTVTGVSAADFHFFLCQTPQSLIFDEDGKLVAGRMWAQMEIPKSKLIGGWKVQGSPNTRTLRGKPRNKRDNMTKDKRRHIG